MAEKILLMVLPAAAVLVILLFKDRISYVLRLRQNPTGACDEHFRTILLNPDWDFYESHLYRPAPLALRELYSDIRLIAACASYRGKREGINIVVSTKPRAFRRYPRAEIGYDIIPFATSGCGDPIFLRPGPNEPDTVYIAYHDDPRHVEVFADSVRVILDQARNVKGKPKTSFGSGEPERRL